MRRGLLELTSNLSAAIRCGACGHEEDLAIDRALVRENEGAMTPSLARTIAAMDLAAAEGWGTSDALGWLCPKHATGRRRRQPPA